VAVNPDPRFLAHAALRRWLRLWFNAPPGGPKPIGVEPQEVIARLVRPELLLWVHIVVEGLDNLPADGGAGPHHPDR